MPQQWGLSSPWKYFYVREVWPSSGFLFASVLLLGVYARTDGSVLYVPPDIILAIPPCIIVVLVLLAFLKLLVTSVTVRWEKLEDSAKLVSAYRTLESI